MNAIKLSLLVGTGIVVVLVLLMIPAMRMETSRTYFDYNNGRIKRQAVVVDLVYHESIEETFYSELLKAHGFAELPANWGWFSAKRIWGGYYDGLHQAGRIFTSLKSIYICYELLDFSPDQTRRHLESLVPLVRNQDSEGIRSIANELNDMIP